MIIGYAYVVGDIIHRGHLIHLRNCSKLCDSLFVGVLSDKACMEKKPKPILSLSERLDIVSSIKYVTVAVCQDEYSPLENCKAVKPDILFESSSHKEMAANNFIKSIGGRVIVMPYYTEQSSTNIKELMKALILVMVILLSGCAGMGFNKKCTLIPDEVSISVDSNPQKDWDVTEVTGGLKWKLS